MKPHRSVVALQWPGLDCLKAARHAIHAGDEVAIELPEGVHYALCRELGAAERLDASGGAEILERISAIHGLEELAQLGGAVTRAHYRVRIGSPDPVVVLRPPERGR
jgi:hypothetical protein